MSRSGTASGQPEIICEEIGKRVQLEILPFLLLTESAERMYSKPRGYAGDYLTIKKIYENIPGGAGRLGPLLDAAFLESAPAKAVRNRRGLLAEEILKCVGENEGSSTRIASLACGPAEEVFDVVERLDDPSQVLATLIDIDMQALAFVSERVEKLHLRKNLKPTWGNLIYLATGRQQLDLVEQDLVYSIGLIDYFADEFVIPLMDYVHKVLRPGGKLILGNFHPSNQVRAFMDHILEWKLIHRTEEDMNRLFSQSSFRKPCTYIRFEEEGVNMFAVCTK